MIMSSLTKDVNQSIQLAKALIQDRDVSDTSSPDVPEKPIQKAYADKPVQEVLSSTRQRKVVEDSYQSDNPRPEEFLSTVKRTDLLRLNDMPKYLQFNPHILTGYRPMLSTVESIKSLFYLHNETVNILSHGIPIVYILWTVPSLIPWETGAHEISASVSYRWKCLSLGRELHLSSLYEPCSRRRASLPQTAAAGHARHLGDSKLRCSPDGILNFLLLSTPNQMPCDIVLLSHLDMGSLQGFNGMVSVGEAIMLCFTIRDEALPDPAKGNGSRGWRSIRARQCLSTGFCVADWWHHRSNTHPGKMVSRAF
ncbi:UNVERIFIED_CONTAM: hypothetical protein PYX00_002741 [Menopon gallinae]|uniref:Uncharacterized protein n=1 Tax=Menopon gallinae TaxID=328185 RepID=A0AAW2HZ07_9NEOP